MSEELSLSERIRQNQLANERATAQRDQAKRDLEARQTAEAQAELDQYNKQVEQYNLELEQYNKELAEAEKQNQKSDYEVRIESINKEYDTKINELIEARKEDLRNVPRTQTIVRKGADIVRPASRKQIQIYERNVFRKYDAQIKSLQSKKSKEIQQTQLQKQYPGAILGRSALNRVESGSTYLQAYERQQANFEARRMAQRRTDIAKGQSYAITERAKIEQRTQEIIQARKPEPVYIFSKEPTKAGDLKPKPTPPQRTLTQPAQEIISPDPKNIQTFETQQAQKQELLEKTLSSRTSKPLPVLDIQKPIQKESSAILTKAPKQAKDIIGSTVQKSEQAVFTFEETQKQQKELSQKLSQAKTSKEAIQIKEQYQKINPYVGTPQKAFTKQGTAEQGILIEKINLSTKEEIALSKQPPKEIITEKELSPKIITTEQETFGLKDSTGKVLTRKLSTGQEVTLKFSSRESAQKYIDRISKQTTTKTQIPSYSFIDPSTDKPIKADSTILYKSATNLLETQVKEPTKADIEFNQELREALKKDPNIIIYKDTKSAEPLIQEPLAKSLTDYGTEFSVLGEDVISLINPEYKRKIKSAEPSLETTGATELIQRGSYAIGITKEPVKESQTIKYFSEKIKTPQGIEYLAGSVIASGSVIIASGGRSILKNPLKASIKESKILKDIAEQIFKKEDSSLARLRELNPELSESELVKLKEVLYPKGRSEKEINLINLLKEKSPNLPQERIDFIVSQASKADAIKLYQKQTYLKSELKKRFPQMSQKQIEQKVATMTAKESEEIPYSIEKINEKSYLISAGRESKQSETPFIVVSFQKSRLGKEIGTFQVYEPKQTVTSPKDIIIQGIQSKELESGKVITKTRGSKTVQYPPTPYNIQRAADPDSQLAIIGTVKTGSLKDLKQYPKETVQSMIESSRKSAILETKQELDALIKIEKSAKQKYNLGLKESKTITTKPKTPDIKITESKPTVTTAKGIQTPTTPKEILNIKTVKQITPKEKLINIAKSIESQKASDIKTATNLRSVSGLTLASISTANIKQDTRQRTESQTQTKSDFKISQRDLTITIPDKAEITKQRDLITEKNIIKERITERQKQFLSPRFSLITVPGLGEKLDQGTKLDIITDLTQVTKQTEIFKFPRPPDEPPLKTTRTPGGIILPDLTKKEKLAKSLKGLKRKTVYFSWNVNLEQPGRYLPTKDLVVGTSPKVLKRTNKLQRQVSSGAYSKRQDKAITRSLDKSITKPTQNRKTKSFLKKEKPFKYKIKF